MSENKTYHDDPSERITVVAWTDQGPEHDPFPLFAVETQDAGEKLAQELVELHGGKSRWITIPLQRASVDYDEDDPTHLIPPPEAEASD